MKYKVAFILTNIHIIIKVIAGIIMNKVISVYLGPSGLALLGQFQNTTGLISSIGHGSIQTGNVKYISENKNDEENLKQITSTSFIVILVLTLIISILTFIFSLKLSELTFYSAEYSFIFKFLSFSLIFYSLNIYLLSVINGLEKIKLFTLINIILSLVSLISVSILTIYFKLSGALISLVLSQSLVFIICYFIILNKFGNSFFLNIINFKYFKKKITLKLFKFSIATFSSGAIVAITMLIIRYIITSKTSIDSAGIWESGWRILVYFNMIFAIPFSIFYFPKFSKSIDMDEILKMLYDSIKFNLPLMLALSIIIIVFKNFFIVLLFSEEFLDLSLFLNYIIFAEIFRILGIFIHNIYLAKTHVFTTILFQIFFFSTFIVFTYLTIDDYGLIGVGVSYLAASILYLLSYILFLFKKNPVNMLIN